jgi:M6 family metalloprotease-like protein
MKMKKPSNRRLKSLLAIATILWLIPTSIYFSNVQILAIGANPPPWEPWSISGEQKLVVICSEFSDVSHSMNSSTIKNRLDKISEYYSDMSSGRITFNITFYGDHWERLNNTMAYYGNGTYDEDNNGYEFLKDSLKAWEKFVNYSNYDHLLVIHAGEDQSSNVNNTDLLWRHCLSNFAHNAKITVSTNTNTYDFWGLAYDSEFEEWGLIAHEIGHSLGLPDLYIENETRPMDHLSLMARGDRNGSPEGTTPSALDGFSMYMLGWAQPNLINLSYEEEMIEINSSKAGPPNLLLIPLTESTYYLVQVREKTGYDEFTVDSNSLEILLVNVDRQSKSGIVTLPENGLLTEGKVFSDTSSGVFLKFISFDSSSHSVTVGFSSNMFFVDMDFPVTVQSSSPVTGSIRIYDGNDVAAAFLNFTLSIDGEEEYYLTDTYGFVTVDLGILSTGTHIIQVSSSHLMAGELEKNIEIVEAPIPFETILLIITAGLLVLFILIVLLKRN